MNIRKTITSEIEWNTIKKEQADTDETQLELFSTERSRVKERPGNGTWWYWLRSPNGGYSAYFCDVISNGNAFYINASRARGVAFGFCL